MFELFRSAAIDDLKVFLELRAEELSDNGEGLFLMVGGGSLGNDKFDRSNPYGGQQVGFLNHENGSIFKEAFENAAKDVQNKAFSNEIKRAQLASFAYYFMRCESDVLESFDHVKDVLELKELKWKNCPITCGSSKKLGDFIWSIHGHSLNESVKTMINEDSSIPIQEKNDMCDKIINALKRHLYILTERDFPEGNTTASYMYMVVRRKPRK